jgi:hypothetical protein
MVADSVAKNDFTVIVPIDWPREDVSEIEALSTATNPLMAPDTVVVSMRLGERTIPARSCSREAEREMADETEVDNAWSRLEPRDIEADRRLPKSCPNEAVSESP